MMYPARTTRPKPASAENRRAPQRARAISELGVLHARQIGNSEKPSAQTSSLISAAVGVVAPRCWSKVSRAFLTSFCRNPRIAQQIGNSMSQLSRRIDRIVPPPTRSSVANDAHRRIVHKSARRRPTSCAVNFPTRNDANGRNRFCAHALHFDALRDERAGDENRLLSHFLLSLLAPLDRCIGKRGAGRD